MNSEININVQNQAIHDLKEWLECKDFILCMKGIHWGSSIVDTSSLSFSVACNETFTPTHFSNFKINKHLVPYIDDHSESAFPMAEAIAADMTPDLVKLLSVPLRDKRDVLRHMQIIPTPIAAAYLGMSEDDLNKSKNNKYFEFGSPYLGNHCYSLEELNLIANNIEMTEVRDFKRHHLIKDVAHNALDQVVMVDAVTACAFTNMPQEELVAKVPHTALQRRRYRLSDLEKVRIAKLASIN